MRAKSAIAGLAAAALLLAGCGDSNAPDNSHVGHYAMVSVDGDPLPITVEDTPGFAVTLFSGELVLNANKTFVQSVTVAFTVFGEPEPPETLSCGGRYERRGSTLTMTSTGNENCEAGTLTGTLSGNQVTVVAEGSEIIFRR
jgi:hypothetical protein